jgi:hypothetical protein
VGHRWLLVPENGRNNCRTIQNTFADGKQLTVVEATAAEDITAQKARTALERDRDVYVHRMGFAEFIDGSLRQG